MGSSYATTLQSGGVSPQIQSVLQAIQALESQASGGTVGYRFRHRNAGAHLMTAEYRGGAHLELVNHWGPVMGLASSILGVVAAVLAFTPVGATILCTIAGLEITLAGACAITAAVGNVVGQVDDMEGW